MIIQTWMILKNHIYDRIKYTLNTHVELHEFFIIFIVTIIFLMITFLIVNSENKTFFFFSQKIETNLQHFSIIKIVQKFNTK